MKKNLMTKIVASLALLCAVQGAVYAAEPAISGMFILKNNSNFNIKYKLTKPEEAVLPKEEILLQPGETVMVDTMMLSIRRSGTGSTFVSSWVRVPNVSDLMQQLSINNFNSFDLALRRGCLPIINIQSSYTGGWAFSLALTCL